MSTLLSVVVPCFNEATSIEELCARVFAASDGQVERTEILLIDDGSRDNTAELAHTLAAADPRIRLLELSRNFGKEAAMLAGLRHAQGDCVIIMDGDLQHPPELIGDLLSHWYQGFDQVLARRSRAGDPKIRTFVSKLFYRVTKKFMNVDLVDGVGDFRLLSRKAVDAVLQLTEHHRFSKGLFAWVGFPTATVDYANVTRAHGQSSWSFLSLANYAVDGILGFNDRPLRMAVHAGMALFVVFVGYLVFLGAAWLTKGIEVPGYLTTIATIVGIGGIQMITLGLVGEYVGRIYFEVKQRPHFLISRDTARPELTSRPQPPATQRSLTD